MRLRLRRENYQREERKKQAYQLQEEVEQTVGLLQEKLGAVEYEELETQVKVFGEVFEEA